MTLHASEMELELIVAVYGEFFARAWESGGPLRKVRHAEKKFFVRDVPWFARNAWPGGAHSV
ncbi:MAG TPA: hypothetical protein VL522_06100 [Bordetella sp.]|nr:hypothetical protein [Bordetella sp.]